MIVFQPGGVKQGHGYHKEAYIPPIQTKDMKDKNDWTDSDSTPKLSDSDSDSSASYFFWIRFQFQSKVESFWNR